MPNPVVAMVGSGVASAASQASASRSASRAQQEAADAGISEQRAARQSMEAMLAPFVQGGTDAFSEMLNLSGGSGAEAQRQAIGGVEASPLFQSALAQGENAILQNAAATGGLRGGNTQAALAQFAPNLLSQAVSDQFGQLGSIASLGQSSAAMTGNAGLSSANNISNLLQQQGAAQAGGALARGQAITSGIGALTGGLGYAQTAMPEGASLFGRWGF